MDSLEVACAICGSCFLDIEVKKWPPNSRGEQHQTGTTLAPDEAAGENESGGEGSDPEDMEHYYDGDVIDKKGLEWLKNLRVLGFNSTADIQKAFISGAGSYAGDNVVKTRKGDDPNVLESDQNFDPDVPEDDDEPYFYSCYYCIDGDASPAMPFHDRCYYEVLSRALTGSPDSEDIDKDILYNVMAELSPEYGCRLKLDYGSPSPSGEQYWESKRGDEVVVSNPVNIPNFQHYLVHAKTIENLISLTSEFNLLSRVVNDPFGNIPYDVLLNIFSHLTGNSTRALMVASWPVHSAMRSNSLWKQLIQRDMPWLWEFQEAIAAGQMQETDFKKLYLDLNRMTEPRPHLRSPFLGLANRRRVWGICQQLADLYFQRISREGPDNEPIAKAI